jgi:hypothetical protein
MSEMLPHPLLLVVMFNDAAKTTYFNSKQRTIKNKQTSDELDKMALFNKKETITSREK